LYSHFSNAIMKLIVTFLNSHDEIESFLIKNKRTLDPPIYDLCSVHPDCQTCIDDPENKCGWCSTEVIYKNGSVKGKQCAGHNGNGTKEPFICNGVYTTETCTMPTTISTSTSSTGSTSTGSTSTSSTSTSTTGSDKKKYECNPDSATCEEGTSGTFDYKMDCEAQCRKSPIPIDLVGKWRGLQINKGYIIGEWKASFSQTNVTITRPDGDSFAGLVSLIGKYLTISPISGPLTGKKIQTLWQISYAPETKFLAWAWGVPGGNPPNTFDSAMIDSNNAEFVFATCLPGKDTKICNFDH